MRNRYFIFTFLLFSILNLFSQIECYSTFNYEYIDNNSEDLTARTGQIGICYSPNYFSINLDGKITTFPIMKESITMDKTSSGFAKYSFINDASFLFPNGFWSVEIIYEKTRVVVLNNTVRGQAYVMKFKGAKYHEMKYRVDPDSLYKLEAKNVKLNKDHPACKYCDGFLTTFGNETHCGRCKRDSSGFDYRLTGPILHFECNYCNYKQNFKNGLPTNCPSCGKDSLGIKKQN